MVGLTWTVSKKLCKERAEQQNWSSLVNIYKLTQEM
jgi:hypothetical protein